MSNNPASYIEFDTPDPADLTEEQRYQYYYNLCSQGNVEALATFIAALPTPVEFLAEYEKWVTKNYKHVEQVDAHSNIGMENLAPEIEKPANPKMRPEGMGGIPPQFRNFPVLELDAQGNPIPDQFGGWKIKTDGAGNRLFSDGQGNIIRENDRNGLGDATSLFSMDKAQGGKNYR